MGDVRSPPGFDELGVDDVFVNGVSVESIGSTDSVLRSVPTNSPLSKDERPNLRAIIACTSATAQMLHRMPPTQVQSWQIAAKFSRIRLAVGTEGKE